MISPTVGVVTAIADDHQRTVHGDRRATAREKAKLLEAIPATGIAVLNADDPLVREMVSSCRCRIVWFGRSEGADLRLLSTTGSWPERLTLRVCFRGEEMTLESRFVGELGALPILAATLTALELGIDVGSAAKTVETFEPIFNRMSVHRGQRGEWYILDAAKAPADSLAASMEFLRQAQATRKTVVLGTISDYAGAGRRTYQRSARSALAVADRVFFVGTNAFRPRRVATGELADRLIMDEQPSRLIPRLLDDVQPDELVYVKGSEKTDHLGRLLLEAIDGADRVSARKM
jgi:UDP-N-acetylmuramoyl-tripeptide--D-alanyl-D-alanine ligase